MLLKDQVAIITGAGRGIGYGIAERFLLEGATVVIAEKVAERGAEAAQSLGDRALAFEVDVTQPEQVRAVVSEVTKRFGRLDILVNNAGLFILGRAEEQPPEDWRVQVDVMLNGVFFCSQAAAVPMIKQGKGAIVNISSIGGLGGWPMRGPYNAAKAGVINLTETLATEWAQHGIRVNSVAPGVIRTDMMDVAIKAGTVRLDQYENRTPMGRVGEVREIAAAVTFLASDRASFITGTTLRVDGGWAAWAALPVGVPERGEVDR
jgi:NAD(P)-dependent dehydrogenase (short-subunit alcohol dehydrogenase family)